MSSEPTRATPLPCPECRQAGRGGYAKIGNRRRWCSMCNSFAQDAMRLTRKWLRSRHAEEYQEIMEQVERDLYPQYVDKWMRRNPPEEDE